MVVKRQVSLSGLKAITKHNIVKALEKLKLTKREYNDIIKIATDVIDTCTIDQLKQKGIVKHIIYGGMPKRDREDDEEDDEEEEEEEQQGKPQFVGLVKETKNATKKAPKIEEPKGKQTPDDRKRIRKRLTTQVEDMPLYQKPERKNYYVFTSTTPAKRTLTTGQQLNPDMRRPQQTEDDIQHELYKSKQRATKTQQREQRFRNSVVSATE